MKINWNFLLGIVFGMAFMTIGILNNRITDRSYASGICIFLIVIWFIGVIGFSKKRPSQSKGGKNG